MRESHTPGGYKCTIAAGRSCSFMTRPAESTSNTLVTKSARHKSTLNITCSISSREVGQAGAAAVAVAGR